MAYESKLRMDSTTNHLRLGMVSPMIGRRKAEPVDYQCNSNGSEQPFDPRRTRELLTAPNTQRAPMSHISNPIQRTGQNTKMVHCTSYIPPHAIRDEDSLADDPFHEDYLAPYTNDDSVLPSHVGDLAIMFPDGRQHKVNEEDISIDATGSIAPKVTTSMNGITRQDEWCAGDGLLSLTTILKF
jgi:hypothetical protein